jgi:uncharacterized protein YdaU (DUF1376 family)
MNRPWMPLYIADYRADTAHLSASEHGAYLLLIMHYWQTGGLPKADAPLSRIACMSPAEWRRAKPVVAPFFGDDWASHKRIDEELAKASGISGKRRAAAELRHSKPDANAQQEHTQPPSPPPTQIQSLNSFQGIGSVGQGRKPPRHGAYMRAKGLVYFYPSSPEWDAHTKDFVGVHGRLPLPDANGGYWFKMAGEAPLPIRAQNTEPHGLGRLPEEVMQAGPARPLSERSA